MSTQIVHEQISLANPFKPAAMGWVEADETITQAATYWSEGEIVGFERVAELVTPELAYILEFERYRAKIGGAVQSTPVNLMVDQHPPTRERHLEDRSSPRRSDHRSARRFVGGRQ